MRRNRGLSGAGLLALLLVLLNLPGAASRGVKAAVREALAPLHALVSGATLRLRETGATLRGLGGLVSENRAMAEELLRLRDETRTLRALERENAELRALLGFAPGTAYGLVPSEVIARDVSGWWKTVRLGVGRRDGVRPDQAVVTAEGLAGRTVDVSASTADVLLISDPTCRVAARLPRTGAFGVVSGRGVRRDGRVICRIDFINRNVPVRAGDEVVTSGLGGVFPAGIPIGIVEEVARDPSGLYQYASIRPRAGVGLLRHAFVIVESAEAVEALWRARPAGAEDEP